MKKRRFKVTVYKKNRAESQLDEINGGVNELLNFIIKTPGLNTCQLTTQLNHSQRTLERWLKQLKDEQIIEYRGSSKTGGYYAK